jgi:photosystem II stability/assembly factor-like uncharacterized protein
MLSPLFRTSLLLLLAGCALRSEPASEVQHPAGVTYRWRQRLDENGRVPDNAMSIALAQQARVPSAQPMAGVRNWTWSGPGNVGGRIRGLLIHPTQPNTMWVAGVTGGVWKTTNGGGIWQPQNGTLTSLTICCLAMDPNDPDRLYAGTGEGFFDTVEGTSNTAAVRGAGIFRSTDGGASWAQLAATATPAFYYVNRIAIQKGNSSVLVAATNSGIWRSTDAGASWSPRTTTRTLDLRLHPTDDTRLVAGRADGVAQFSVDGGATWSNATGITGARRIEVAYSRSAPTTVYAAVTATSSVIRIWRSTDGGQSYTLQTSGSGISTYNDYNSALWVDPLDPNLVVFGGISLYRSTNGGVSYSSISSGVHSDIHTLLEHPGYDGVGNATVYCANDGGIHRTTSMRGTASWTELNNNLGITQFYGAAIHPTSGVIMAGAQDNGTQRTAGGTENWTSTFGGDGGFCATDPVDPNYFYGESQRFGAFRSTNGGVSGSSIARPSESSWNFIPYFMIDPNDSNRMLACGAQLWRSNNIKAATVTWASIKPATTACNDLHGGGPPQAHFQDNPPCNVSTVAIAEGNPNLIWVGHNSGALYKTTNGTAATPTWTKVDDNTPSLPNRWVSRIVIDRRNHDRVFVALLGYAGNNVWKTEDGGQNWTPIGGSGVTRIPDVPVAALAQHRVLPEFVYAGTDLGVFYSEDGGRTWTTSAEGPGIVAIDELVWRNDRTLLAVTHGRGCFVADIEPASVTPVGTGCGATAPPVLTASAPILGRTQSYNLGNAAPNSPTALLLAPGPAVSVQLGNGCTGYVDLQTLIAVPGTPTNGAGQSLTNLLIPNDAGLVGGVATAQMFVQSSGGPLLGVGELSNGAQLRLGF